MKTDNIAIPLVDGPEIIEHVGHALKNAQQYIYITAWMLHPAMKLGNHSLFRLLQNKVGEGIDVRVLLSDVDPTMKVSVYDRSKLQIIERWEHRRVKQMNKNGIKTHLSKLRIHGVILNRLIAKVSEAIGYSIRLAAHHQKSVVVDGKIGFCMGSDLVMLLCYPARWHEAAVMVKGPGVLGLEQNFVERWNSEAVQAGFDSISRGFRSATPTTFFKTLKTIPQPFIPKTEIREAYCSAIRDAKRSIYIQNQYFRDPKIAEELIASICRGVDVCIVLPNLPEEIRLNDSNLMSLANSISMFAQYRILKSLIALEPAGLQADFSGLTRLQGLWPRNLSILHPSDEQELYIHAKLMIVDERRTLIGSANLNGRSMNGKCDSELNLMIESGEFAAQLSGKLANSLKKANLITYDQKTLDRDERLSRIHDEQRLQIIWAFRQHFALGSQKAFPNWLPKRIRTKLITVGNQLASKSATAFLSATDAVAFRDRLTNLAADFI